MKQIIQNYNTGKLELQEVPVPFCRDNYVLVKNINSLISIGTERSIIDLGKKSLLGKAKARPDLVKRVIEKARNEGLVKTFQEALGRLDTPVPLGYSSSGIVIETGKNVHRFSQNDRVACIGAGYASHAEYIAVPENLCCRIPPEIGFEEAAFGMLGIISLHGIRCSGLSGGDTAGVIGLGLLGLLSIQILSAYGCEVTGYDIDSSKVQAAKNLGFKNVFDSKDDFVNCIEKITEGNGADSIIITAAAKSREPVDLAVEVSRYRGKVVIVGVAEINPDRNEMWHKEVEIIVSKGGGAGVLDPVYENKGIDYPFGYVRWTENRNLKAFLSLVAEQKVKLKSLISHRVGICEGEKIYNDIINNTGGPYIGVLFEYQEQIPDKDDLKQEKIKTIDILPAGRKGSASEITAGVVGAGIFGKAVLLPILKKVKNIELKTVCVSSGFNSYHAAKKFGFKKCTTDNNEIFSDSEINTVFILTPHSTHCSLFLNACRTNKNIFIEKPLCINKEELGLIKAAAAGQKNSFFLEGYNRRFSPHGINALNFLGKRNDPVIINYRINAGYVAPSHWVHSEEEGGSRIIGEMCHFIDFMQFITNSSPLEVFAERISGNNSTSVNNDNLIVVLKFSDGSAGNIIYSGSGDRLCPRERIEMFCEGRTVIIHDFKMTEVFHKSKKKVFKTFNQELGHREEIEHFLNLIRGIDPVKLSFNDMYLSALTTFKIEESLASGKKAVINE